MIPIDAVTAREVLDSRGDPTVHVAVDTPRGRGTFAVPSGASTGTHEAVERRDGGDRFGGRGVREAVTAIEEELAPLVLERDVTEQRAIDAALRAYDGTPTLEAVGGNAVLGISGAVAHAAADALGEPLYSYLAADAPGSIPRPMVNVLSGGLHAEGGLSIQDVLAVPMESETYDEALQAAWEVRRAARDEVIESGHRPLVADEGGFAPPLADVRQALEFVRDAIGTAGYRPSRDGVAIALDVAATHLRREDGRYELDSGALSADRMIERVLGWIEDYPIVSVEDPLAEDDWANWSRLREGLDPAVQLVGDDLLVTDVDRLERAIEEEAANAVLVKPNQAGTLSDAIDVIDAASRKGLAPVVSARSGETCDATIADLAVARDAGQIKIGSLARSERLAKYNRLLTIADEHHDRLGSRP